MLPPDPGFPRPYPPGTLVMEDNPFSGIKACDSYWSLFRLLLFVLVPALVFSVGAICLLDNILGLGLDRAEVGAFIQGASYTLFGLWVLKDLGVDFKAVWRDWNAKAGRDALDALKYFAVYLLIIGAMLAVVMLAMRFSGIAEAELVRRLGGGNNESYAAIKAVMGVSPPGFALRLFTMCVLTPIGEELLFRRVIYAALRKKMSFLRALFFSSVIFAAGHGVAILLVFPVGLLLGYVYEKKRRLPVNILLHGLINLFALAVRLT